MIDQRKISIELRDKFWNKLRSQKTHYSNITLSYNINFQSDIQTILLKLKPKRL